eukprot:CAMPEP_0195263814 /NCGR_PEP_ID=MMETSP0706-20130129/10514_1 /TAXON_ID=33640 /ORGANISM="Asterionellopsis glacialis, Strain CCMP134" /LENGTH=264 /DNA_ID=CAMNT_0040318037 /DNA_START=125 /DNA_END=919 /DNA_ORIENTATION=+
MIHRCLALLLNILSVANAASLGSSPVSICSNRVASTSQPRGGFQSSSILHNAQNLEQKVLDLFDSSSTLPVSISRPKEGIEVRTSFEGNNIVTIAEAKMVRKHPDCFKGFLTNFNDSFPKVNPMVQNVDHLETDEYNSREGVKSILKFPYPLKKRIMIHWKYLLLNRSENENEHMLIFSEGGNKNLMGNYFTPKEKKDFVLGKTYLSAYWIKPVYDSDKKNIIGTTIRYVFSGDTGGTIPQWIQNAVGPKTALDSVKGIINHVI